MNAWNGRPDETLDEWRARWIEASDHPAPFDWLSWASLLIVVALVIAAGMVAR